MNIVQGIKMPNFSRKVLKMSSLENEYANDLYNIEHYKKNIDNLDYTTFMNFLDKNEFSRMYIDNANNNVYSVDTNIHMTHIDPEIPFSLVQSISAHSIPLYFIHFNNFFTVSNILNIFLLSITLYFLVVSFNLLNEQTKND